jgi:hypothetical protein
MTLHSALDHGAHKSGSKDESIEVQLKELSSPTHDLSHLEVDISAVDPRKLKRKIDFRLLPWLTLLYLLCFLDRGSIGNARVCTPLRVCASCTHSCAFIPLSRSYTTCNRACISQTSSIAWRSPSSSFPMHYSR